MRRFFALLVAVLVASAWPWPHASAQETEEVHDIVFPALGDVSYTDTFGEPRSGGRNHEGQDLLGEKMQELVAADSGTIAGLVWPEGSYGNYLKVLADDGYVYSYVHINNDTPGTDDDSAARQYVYADGIDNGVHVERGQLIAYLGDSGNAESTRPHLHFEMHRPDGSLMNPMASLDAAEHVDAPVGQSADPSPIARLAGEDRVATAVAVSARGWPDGAAAAVLAAGDAYAEALPASVLAGAVGGPLLLVTGDSLPDTVAAELQRLNVASVTVVGSVPESVDAALEAAGRAVPRVGVVDAPVKPAAAVAREIGGASGVAVLVNRSRFADGVSAAGHGWPILLSDSDVIPQVSVDEWRSLGVGRLVLVGGTGVLGANIESFIHDRGRCATGPGCAVDRLAGTDRYATSVAVAERSLQAGDRSVATVLLGTGGSYPDTLSSGPLAARLAGVGLLVDGSGRRADESTRSFLSAHASSVSNVAILGGPGAVTSAADRAIQEALGIA